MNKQSLLFILVFSFLTIQSFGQTHIHFNINMTNSFLDQNDYINDDVVLNNLRSMPSMELGVSYKSYSRFRTLAMIGVSLTQIDLLGHPAIFIDTITNAQSNSANQLKRFSFAVVGLGGYYQPNLKWNKLTVNGMMKVYLNTSARSSVYGYYRLDEDLKVYTNNIVPVLSLKGNYGVRFLELFMIDLGLGFDIRPMAFLKTHRNRSPVVFQFNIGGRLNFEK